MGHLKEIMAAELTEENGVLCFSLKEQLRIWVSHYNFSQFEPFSNNTHMK